MFNTLFYQPLYNGLIFLLAILPFKDVGVVIVIFTVLIRLILFPLSKKSIETQVKMKEIEPELNLLKEKYKDNKEEQARKMMELYRNNKVNPFSSIFFLLVQIPIIFALYFIFINGGLPSIDIKELYSFIPHPGEVSMHFLGLIDIGQKSVFLAFLAGITQYFQAYFMPTPPKKESNNTSFKDDFARSMHLQMRYVFPVMIFFIAWNISGAVALYWATSNLFTIGQEFYVRKNIKGQKQ